VESQESQEEQDDTDGANEPESQEREESWESQERESQERESQEIESQESIGHHERSRSQVRPQIFKRSKGQKVTELGNTKTPGKSKETR
jgi:hypothetical protein